MERGASGHNTLSLIVINRISSSTPLFASFSIFGNLNVIFCYSFMFYFQLLSLAFFFYQWACQRVIKSLAKAKAHTNKMCSAKELRVPHNKGDKGNK